MNDAIQDLALGHHNSDGTSNANHDGSGNHIRCTGTEFIAGGVDTQAGDHCRTNAQQDHDTAHLGKIPTEFQDAEHHCHKASDSEHSRNFLAGVQDNVLFLHDIGTMLLIQLIGGAFFRVGLNLFRTDADVQHGNDVEHHHHHGTEAHAGEQGQAGQLLGNDGRVRIHQAAGKTDTAAADHDGTSGQGIKAKADDKRKHDRHIHDAQLRGAQTGIQNGKHGEQDHQAKNTLIAVLLRNSLNECLNESGLLDNGKRTTAGQRKANNVCNLSKAFGDGAQQTHQGGGRGCNGVIGVSVHDAAARYGIGNTFIDAGRDNIGQGCSNNNHNEQHCKGV